MHYSLCSPLPYVFSIKFMQPEFSSGYVSLQLGNLGAFTIDYHVKVLNR